MKKIETKRFIYMAAAFSLLLCGCSKEDAYHQDDADNAIGTVLSLQVNAAAYQSSTGTRATDAELTTTFTSGDRLGVIITHQGGSTEHTVYTYNGSAWISSAPAYYDPQDTYAAYYPYRESLQGKSLADVKAAFTPLIDQSDYANGYAASDLMTCESATLNTTNKTLSITLTHAFSMLRMPVTDIPVKSKCGDDNTYEYSLPGTDIAFHIDDIPYRAWVDGDGYARLIVSNSGSGIAVKSCYTFQGKRAETSCTISSFASGQYYTVAPLPTDLGEYQLSNARVGDFYIKSSDGQSGFVFPKEASFPESLKSSCLGVVLKVGKDESGDWKDDCQYKKKGTTTAMSTINGYVLALYDANGGSTCQWESSNTQVNHADMNRDKETGFYGYKNTQAIISFNKSKSGTLSSAFPATYYATTDYEARENSKYASPANSSGWFLPSAGQCKYWLNNKETLLESVRKATGDSGYSWKSYYWSSSEYSIYPAAGAWCAGFYGRVDDFTKNRNYYVRSCLAF